MNEVRYLGINELKNFLKDALELPDKEDRTELFGLKARISGYILSQSQKNIPSPGYTYEADITDFWNKFKELKKECGYHLSFNTLMMKVLAEGLKAAPRLNAHLVFNDKTLCGKLIIKKHINVAMPVIMDNGETFPLNVQHVEDKSLEELTQQIEELTNKLKNTDVNSVLLDMVSQRYIGYVLKGKNLVTTLAQAATGFVGKYKVTDLSSLVKKKEPRDETQLSISELKEGTVCLTNWGNLYEGLHGDVTYTPLLYPQVFLMAIGNIRDREVPFKNEKGEIDLATKKVLPITLLFDHRIGGFNDVMPFIRKVDEIFENPEIIKTW